MDEQMTTPGERRESQTANVPPPRGYSSRFVVYPPHDQHRPPTPYREEIQPPQTYGPSDPYYHYHYPSPPYTPYPPYYECAPYWPPVSRSSSSEEPVFAPPAVTRMHNGREFLPVTGGRIPPSDWPSPPKENHNDRHEERNGEGALDQSEPPSTPFMRAKELQEKSSPSSQATEHTSNIQANKEKKKGDPLSLLAKTASDMGPTKRRSQELCVEAVTTPPAKFSVSPIPTSNRPFHQEKIDEHARQSPKPITPMGGPYSTGISTPYERRPAPPPPQYSHRAYHPNSLYRYEPWQQMDGPVPVCSFDSHDSVNRGAPLQPPSHQYYYSDSYNTYHPPPPEAYRGPHSGHWYPSPPPQAHFSSYYRPVPSTGAPTKRGNGPYTRVQQSYGDEKHILRKKFSWKQYPELEQFLVQHRDEYLIHSCKNYSLEQKQYNNWLTQRLIEVAEANDLYFDPQDFSFVAVRDRIRCYYKSYVQTARKRGLPLPRELETSRNILNSKKPRLEDIDFTHSDEDDDTGVAADKDKIEIKEENVQQPKEGLQEDASVATRENKNLIDGSTGYEDRSRDITVDKYVAKPAPGSNPGSDAEVGKISSSSEPIEAKEIGRRMTTRGPLSRDTPRYIPEADS